MTFYVPRAQMPQIDYADYPELLAFAEQNGVSWELISSPPGFIVPHQHVISDKLRHMSREDFDKPILVSVEPFVIDGHHRWARHDQLGVPVEAYQFDLDFDKALAFMFSFPKTYTYGDGQFHPVVS